MRAAHTGQRRGVFGETGEDGKRITASVGHRQMRCVIGCAALVSETAVEMRYGRGRHPRRPGLRAAEDVRPYRGHRGS